MVKRVTFVGVARLKRKLGKLPGSIERAARRSVKDETKETAADMRRLAPKLTGHLAESVQEELTANGLGGRVWPSARYAQFVNDGARGVAAQPFATAAAKLSRKRFKARTVKIEKEALKRLAAGG
jgi:HK97 gp10 family phage protein